MEKLIDKSFYFYRCLRSNSKIIPSLRNLGIYGDLCHKDYLFHISITQDTLLDQFIKTSYKIRANKYKFVFLNKEIKNLFKISEKIKV